ncbi:DNA-binding transcriptional regulator, LysR family [Streptoalloteichus tenebrarius]|uniref:DNA-binding transcriptional regulator, LysR family n=1 Tax=Streptoalloteichus tenebrarius (strain ATCC 17920 / DSM 40477 / JCM 4838 / CBS 697.72 / NBRC 16177 / NCIMB 11028 / NRRL B-12390 / A12253. 1 / ISP 5477) TaxID=1933 RepID=A0ABT1HMA1_STRSD|nr:LysR substrate-binding domain-containing protein [Streptoalloteichus tenebrarius]MCP2256649.1 DNA-binding transcriptional regulator, LysR family [Streptoalloteichus tenebrarius]BFF05003.1 LysR family transcriptional regulator [Streptoalloteichus tenebrarius]
MEGVETRELVYFLAVATELHFTRAAERLGIAQPALSKAIRVLERRLGVRLLDRDSHRVALTEAGEVLLHEGRHALDAVTAAVRRTRRAGQDEPRLVLVMKPGGDRGLLPDILAAYDAEPGMPPVEVVVTNAPDRADRLRDGRADLALLHRPRDDLRGLDAEELAVEQQVAVMPRHHRLASRRSLRMADLRGEPLPRWVGTESEDATGPEVTDTAQLSQLVALGRVVAVLPESLLAPLRPELVCVPVLDATPSTLVLAWPEQSRSPAVAAFVRAATAVSARRLGTVDDDVARVVDA